MDVLDLFVADLDIIIPNPTMMKACNNWRGTGDCFIPFALVTYDVTPNAILHQPAPLEQTCSVDAWKLILEIQIELKYALLFKITILSETGPKCFEEAPDPWQPGNAKAQ